mmetsp:Transcript_7488/g.17142  ORF Transcript_7488/g.17142 Transcript_7488/m.17142 type:complete len:348 (-) Transcript_7488:178-1221(-)
MILRRAGHIKASMFRALCQRRGLIGLVILLIVAAWKVWREVLFDDFSTGRESSPEYCVATRALHESPYLQNWLEWYRRLGFSAFYIQTADDIPDFGADVKVVKISKPVANDFHRLEWELKWTLHVDIDEFLVLQSHAHIDQYVSSLPTDATTIQFRWAMHEDVRPRCGPERLTALYPHSHFKTMFRTKNMKRMTPHHTHVYPALNWRSGAFRPMSHASALTANDSYNEAILVHVHTRSVSNLLTKWVTSQLSDKKVASPKVARDMFSGKLLPTLDAYKKYIGVKLSLPWQHTNNFNKTQATVACDIRMDNFCNTSLEWEDMQQFLGPGALDHIRAISHLMNLSIANY